MVHGIIYGLRFKAPVQVWHATFLLFQKLAVSAEDKSLFIIMVHGIIYGLRFKAPVQVWHATFLLFQKLAVSAKDKSFSIILQLRIISIH